tara:strand:+ start:458 stop:787 length:330 start_codon:yes stop_codon:yes gene_type:complete
MKKGPFKMNPGFDMLPKKVQNKITKKSPAEHNEGNSNIMFPNAGMMTGSAASKGGKTAGMLPGQKNLYSSMAGAQAGQALITKETRKRKSGRDIGAYNMFKNKVKGIFG